MTDPQYGLGDWLREHRRIENVTQDELGSYVGLGRTSIVNIEKGRQGVSVDMFERLCEGINRHPAEYYGREPAPIAIDHKIIRELRNEVVRLEAKLTKAREALK